MYISLPTQTSKLRSPNTISWVTEQRQRLCYVENKQKVKKRGSFLCHVLHILLTISFVFDGISITLWSWHSKGRRCVGIKCSISAFRSYIFLVSNQVNIFVMRLGAVTGRTTLKRSKSLISSSIHI